MRFWAGLAIGFVLLIPQREAPRLNKADGDRFNTKLQRIVTLGNTPRAKGAPAQNTQVTDAEVNAYLKFFAQEQIPVGVVDPLLFASGNGVVSGQATVDLDAVRKQKQRGWLDPMAYLTGRLPLTARGRLTTSNGVGRFELESAELSGVSIPKTVLQELLSYYSRTAEDPDGISMDDPFQLPSQIREIQVAAGTATIIQ